MPSAYSGIVSSQLTITFSNVCVQAKVLLFCLSTSWLAKIVTYTIVPSLHSFFNPAFSTSTSHCSNHLLLKVKVPAAAVPTHLSIIVAFLFLSPILASVNATAASSSRSLDIVTVVQLVSSVPVSWNT